MSTRLRFWNRWVRYACGLGVDPYLEKNQYRQKVRTATGFSGRVRTGAYGQRKQVKVSTVREALGAANQTILMDTGQSPLLHDDKNYLYPIQHMLKGFAKDKPPVKKKKPVEVDVL